MDLAGYLKKKRTQKLHYRADRKLCIECRQPDFNCFCSQVNKFNPKIEFVILIHPLETKRRVATGRMTFLSLENSHILKGPSFGDSKKINMLLNQPGYQNIVLSPGNEATNLTNCSQKDLNEHFPKGKKLRVFVLDSTWSTANKMFKETPQLHKLKRYFFTPDKASNIRVRKQPNDNCHCTLEAIHHVIELLGPSQGFDVLSRQHDNLLRPFNWMIEQQLKRIEKNKNWRSCVKSNQ